MEGKKLLAFAETFDLMITNGRFRDPQGEFTFVASSGKSVVDYILISRELGERADFWVKDLELSDHFPVFRTEAFSYKHQ